MKTNEQLRELITAKGCFSRKENERIYANYFANWHAQHAPLFKKFKITTKERILDIGCSYGMNLAHFDKTSVGLDYNDKLIRFTRGIGLDVRKTNIEKGLGLNRKEKFDLIWVTDFIIHLSSPYLFLLRCRQHMTPNSKIIIQIPQYTPLINQNILPTYRSRTHYYTFNYPTLKYLLEAAGYVISDSSGFVRRFPSVINSVFNPFLKHYGPNIWFMARIDERFKNAKKQKTLVGVDAAYE